MKNLIRTSLLGLLALPLAAQSTSIGGGLIVALDGLKKATNNTTAFQLNAGYETKVPGTEIPTRATLTGAIMPGSEEDGLKTSLQMLMLSSDILIETPVQGLRGVAGLSASVWKQKLSGAEPTATGKTFPMESVNGVKLGFRLGLEYAFTKNVSGEFLFQQTELSGKNTTTTLVRRAGVNPAWFQLGVRYTF